MKLLRLVICVITIIIINPKIIKAEELNMEDVDLLACVINGEAGADYCSEDMRYNVGSVVVNRLNHPEFPKTLKEVIYQEGQYGCINSKYFIPDKHCRRIAIDILINGSRLPKDVVFQSTEPLGSLIYVKEQNMYFCYI